LGGAQDGDEPFLKKIFYGINFTPCIEEAERREKAAKV
jgi:hypothetical protein